VQSGLPQVSGRALARLLQQLGYEVVRQKGSHLRLKKLTSSGEHSVTVPMHSVVAKGTLHDILRAVAQKNALDIDTLSNRLRRM